MAQPAQDGIKEKVQSVREVVPGHSNNEITLVLQYYDYSVEQAIQAYLEDGAKEALQEWHFPGNKDKEKKKKLKKKKAKEQKDKDQGEANETVKSPVAVVEDVVLNGDILSNGTDISQATSEFSITEAVDLLAPPSGTTRLPGAPETSTANSNSRGLTNSTTTLEKNGHNQASDIRVTATSTHDALAQRGKGGGNRDRVTKGKTTPNTNSGPPAANSSMNTSKPGGSKSDTGPPVVVSVPTSNTSSSVVTAAISSQKESFSQSAAASYSKSSDVSSSGTVGASTSILVRPTSQQKSQSRPKALDAAKGRDRTTSERSTTSAPGSGSGAVKDKPGSGSGAVKDKPAPTVHLNIKRPFAGLEKSVKDLHRQTLALTRIKMMLSDEMERCYKKITSVFEDFHTAMNEREADIIYEMDKVKDEASKILSERQKRAADLKKRTDRASGMSESEIAELRHDIKIFVSDRKIDEELGSTHRFQCAAEELTRSIRSFGEVVGVRSGYGQRRNSVSSVSSSCVSHDELTSPSTPMTPMTPATPAAPGLSMNTLNPPLPRVAPTRLEQLEETPKPEPVSDAYAKEIAEMQQKFQAAFKAPNGVKKIHSASSSTGVSSMTSGSLPETPVSTDSSIQSLSASVASSTTSSPQSPENSNGEAAAAKKSRNARRRQMLKERDRKYRDEYRQNQKNSSVTNFSTTEQKSGINEKPAEQKKSQEKYQQENAAPSKQNDKSFKDSTVTAPNTPLKTQNEPRSQSQPGQRFDGRRERSASTRGRPQQVEYTASARGRPQQGEYTASARGRPQQGEYRGNSPSKRGGSNQRVFRGGYYGGNRQGASGNQGQQDQKTYLWGPRPEGQRPKSQSRDRRCQGYQQNRNSYGVSKPTSKDSSSKYSSTRDTSNQSVNNAKVNGDLNNPKDAQHTKDSVNKQVEAAPKKGLETVPESKKENFVQSNPKEAKVENKVERNNNDVDKKPSVPPQSNGPKFVNSNDKVDKSNGSRKLDENSNHRKSSATVRLTNNGNVPHEVSINDAPIVKKSVVSVEEVTRKQELGLPQRKPRLREVKRAEVIVNGDLNGMVNGHAEE